MLKKIYIIASVFILPLILSTVIIWQIKLIQKSKTDYNLSVGTVENFGFTNKIVKGNYKSPMTETKVLFIKLNNNDTIYSFFFKKESKYDFIIANLKQNDYVKIYSKSFTKRKNTVDIIQLEKGQKILIDKNISDRRDYGLVAFLSLILFLYFFLPYKFIWKKR
ncbi:hypothetical protein ASG01_06020 [Chryseobacterium sp. Leaf180]|uniref:hypothetical protein n=1 Tax=Chryseobacterium sp. Leaf180 TaxID=1736289 RepID=UPI0006FD1D10|nr:hypothetical protein [Chryseobacterium sp. Leaf180]KQR95401.1 hypothetical protein ASG01_06020 [Chryseobacterium sp. Leaf180]